MENYVDAEHIQKLIESNEMVCLDSNVSQLAERHLKQSFPLGIAGTIVDWTRVPCTMLKWNTVSDDDTVRWASATMAGKCSFGLLFFTSSQPCLIGPFDLMLKNLDELVWKAPGCRILFGVERNGGIVLFTRGIIEFNGRGELFASIEE